MSEPVSKGFSQWAVVEILGHQSVVGRCSEEQVAGATLLRVDVPHGDAFTTQYVGGGSIYRLRVVSEEVGRKLAANRRDHVPPFAWELEQPARLLPAGNDHEPDGEGPDDEVGF